MLRYLPIIKPRLQMNSNGSIRYQEKLLHWIWKQKHFDFHGLVTVDGKQILIHDTGTLNSTDGADFSSAEITIGNLRWFGDVELHWKLNDWKAHSHHIDTNYDNVILHVVFEPTDNHSYRKDQTAIPTLCLGSYLPKPLRTFLDRYQKSPQLPCAGHLTYISPSAFIEQLKKAHKEYFEKKVDDLITFYDSSLPPSKAWQNMLVITLFDGLGISHNRSPMRKLAKQLLQLFPDVTSRNKLRIQALNRSGLNRSKKSPEIPWRHKGCRPGNHPRLRIQQGVDLLWYIQNLPFEQWLNNDPHKLWQDMLNAVSVNPGIGKERGSILLGTVFLPSLYFLGNLLFKTTLKNKSWDLWQKHKAFIPSSLLELFEDTAIPAPAYRQKLGAVHQLRSYCRPRNCQECKVFKSIISS